MKITPEMIEAALPDVQHLPPMTDAQALQAASILQGVFSAPASAAS